tara:strand:+ start:1056 stop:1247 length:192 start_codon:yes stop_codon:yes gene_type:complete
MYVESKVVCQINWSNFGRRIMNFVGKHFKTAAAIVVGFSISGVFAAVLFRMGWQTSVKSWKEK